LTLPARTFGTGLSILCCVRALGLGRLAIVVLAGLVTMASQGVLPTRTTHPTAKPSLEQLERAIASSVKLVKEPNPYKTVPPLLSLTPADASIVPNRPECYSTGTGTGVPADLATRCAYGDLHASRTILLSGDSQAGMWIPAMNVVGQELGWKVVAVAKQGCSPWTAVPHLKTMIAPRLSASQCDLFNGHVAEWAVENHPAVVMLQGLAYQHTPMQLEQTMVNELGSYKSSGSEIVVLGPPPEYGLSTTVVVTPNDCFDGAAKFTACQASPSTLLPKLLTRAEAAEAHAGRLHLVDDTPLFCTPSKCTIVVKDASGATRLVYYDGLHINRFYSSWIGTALASLLERVLPAH
jgi:hypothetical protein